MKQVRIIGTLIILVSFSFSLHAQRATAVNNSGTIERQVDFKYKNEAITVLLEFKQTDYNFYKRIGKKDLLPEYGNLITEDEQHAYFKQMALTLKKEADAKGYSDQDMVEFLTAFVQYIPYKEDPKNDGYDYPRYPIETIVDGGGDCEDKSALLVALLNTFGFDAIMVSPPGHMAAAIRCENCDEGTYEVRGEKYVYIETTISGWQIGMVPPQFSEHTILDVYR